MHLRLSHNAPARRAALARLLRASTAVRRVHAAQNRQQDSLGHNRYNPDFNHVSGLDLCSPRAPTTSLHARTRLTPVLDHGSTSLAERHQTFILSCTTTDQPQRVLGKQSSVRQLYTTYAHNTTHYSIHTSATATHSCATSSDSR